MPTPSIPDVPVIQNGLLSTRSGYEFPKICLKSESRENLRAVPIKLIWTPGWAYLLLIFPGVLLGAIIISCCINKKAEITAWMSEPEYRKRRNWKMACISLFLVPPIALILGMLLGAPSAVMGFFGVSLPLCWLSSLVLHEIFVRHRVRAKRIDDKGSVLLKGVPTFILNEIEQVALTPPALPV